MLIAVIKIFGSIMINGLSTVNSGALLYNNPSK